MTLRALAVRHSRKKKTTIKLLHILNLGGNLGQELHLPSVHYTAILKPATMLRALRRQNRLREQLSRAAYVSSAWTHGQQQQRQAAKSTYDANWVRGAGFGGRHEVGRGFSSAPAHSSERKPFDGNIFLHHSEWVYQNMRLNIFVHTTYIYKAKTLADEYFPQRM